MEHLDDWEEAETRGMALDYTRQHLKASWAPGWLLPNGGWPESSKGWSLARGERTSIHSLPQATVVWCPPGRFEMGTHTNDPDGTHWESPPTQVHLTRPFWLQTTPVTLAQWQAILSTSPSSFDNPKMPVEMVSWYDAIAFCNALSRTEGLEEAYILSEEEGIPGNNEQPFLCRVEWKGLDCEGYRLPTSAEWEYAARAGTSGPRYSNQLNDIAWTSDNSNGTLHPVARKAPNPWHLFDMYGQVWEWCSDASKVNDVSPYPGGELQDPVNDDYDAQEARVLRGGSWYVPPWYARASYYAYIEPTRRVHNFGFRLARTASVS